MKVLEPEKVRNGTWGSLWLDGEQVAECYACKGVVEKTKEDVKRCNTLMRGHKMTELAGTGSVSIYNATSTLMEKESAALKAGKDLQHTIISLLDDPDAEGPQRIAYYGVSFDNLTLADWSAAVNGTIEAPFTFNDWEILDS